MIIVNSVRENVTHSLYIAGTFTMAAIAVSPAKLSSGQLYFMYYVYTVLYKLSFSVLSELSHAIASLCIFSQRA
jgi:hypothetical protein